MQETILEGENEHKKYGMMVSIILHLCLLLLFLQNLFATEKSDSLQSAIMVNLGDISTYGNTDDNTADDQVELKDKLVEPVKESPKSRPKSEHSPPPSKNERNQNDEIIPKEVESPIVIKKEDPSSTTKDPKNDAKAEAEKQAAEREAERIAEQKRKEEEERKQQEAYEKSKAKFGNILSNSKNSKENDAESGTDNGRPDEDNLDGLAKGSEKVGGGLKGRGVLFEPTVNENSQKTGTVVINICVDKNGKVTSAEYTQRGSTTNDVHLIQVASRAAMKYHFTESDIIKQCGTVTIKFIVR